MVMDHSAGSPSLNNMINHDVIAGIKTDGMRSLSASLLKFQEHHPNVKFVTFKSNVSMAYRCMLMHPLWQLKQVTTHPNGNHCKDDRMAGRTKGVRHTCPGPSKGRGEVRYVLHP